MANAPNGLTLNRQIGGSMSEEECLARIKKLGFDIKDISPNKNPHFRYYLCEYGLCFKFMIHFFDEKFAYSLIDDFTLHDCGYKWDGYYPARTHERCLNYKAGFYSFKQREWYKKEAAIEIALQNIPKLGFILDILVETDLDDLRELRKKAFQELYSVGYVSRDPILSKLY